MKKKITILFYVLSPLIFLSCHQIHAGALTESATETKTKSEAAPTGEASSRQAFADLLTELQRGTMLKLLGTKLEKETKKQQLEKFQNASAKIEANIGELFHKIQHADPQFANKIKDKLQNIRRHIKKQFKEVIALEKKRKHGTTTPWKEIIKDLYQSIDENTRQNLQQFMETIKSESKNKM